MEYSLYLYASLAVFGLGLLYKVSAWFGRKIGNKSRDISFLIRIIEFIKGTVSVIFSIKVFPLLKVLVLDVILQRRILKEDVLRWVMHMFIYGGFVLLLVMHALGTLITANIFSDYYSTLNPFMFLRDLFGLLVLAGLAIAFFRRFILRVPRLSSNAMDIYLIFIVGVIMVSGILLEGLKITSYSRYTEMIEEYSDTDDEADLNALEAFWVKEFSVVSPNNVSTDPDILKKGKEVHEYNCASCHSSPGWAFTGYATAVIIKPAARALDDSGGRPLLFYIHVIACLLALAYLPFSKMFHIIVTPLSLLANGVMDEKSSPANIATRQAMELDACVHCGTCSLRCSALAAASGTGNCDILPSEKMQHLKKFVRGKKLNSEELYSLQEGIYICTNCDRCTVVCPSGINLRDLWYSIREDLINNGNALPFVLSQLSFSRALAGADTGTEDYSRPVDNARKAFTAPLDEIKKGEGVSLADIDKEYLKELGLSTDTATYNSCFTCSTCTTSCPVVNNCDNPTEELGLLPHQIIHSAVLGIKDLAFGSKMLWDCLTCYKCQESCPQGVNVTDVFYRLKEMASKSLRN